MVDSKSKVWTPIESNPDVFTNYAEALGFPTYAYRFHDVLGLEPEMWTVYIPQPVIAAVICFQIKPAHIELIEKD